VTMKLRTGLISGIVGASMLGSVGIATLVAGGGATAATTALLTSSVSAQQAPTGLPTSSGTAQQAPTVTGPTSGPIPSWCLADDSGWPSVVQGEPTGFGAGDQAGVYLWHDGNGWHLRVTHQNDTHQVYSGVLTTTGLFSDVDAVKLEHNDSLVIGPDRHTIAFHFNNYGGIDGFDFRTHCAEGIHFGFWADGSPLPAADVFMGQAAQHPTTDPFVVARQG